MNKLFFIVSIIGTVSVVESTKQDIVAKVFPFLILFPKLPTIPTKPPTNPTKPMSSTAPPPNPTKPVSSTAPPPNPTKPVSSTAPPPNPTKPVSSTAPPPNPTKPVSYTAPPPNPTKPMSSTAPPPNPTNPMQTTAPPNSTDSMQTTASQDSTDSMQTTASSVTTDNRNCEICNATDQIFLKCFNQTDICLRAKTEESGSSSFTTPSPSECAPFKAGSYSRNLCLMNMTKMVADILECIGSELHKGMGSSISPELETKLKTLGAYLVDISKVLIELDYSSQKCDLIQTIIQVTEDVIKGTTKSDPIKLIERLIIYASKNFPSKS